LDDAMAYKALKSVRGIPSGRQAARMMERMGMDLKEVSGVTRVTIETTKKKIVIDEPNVVLVNMQGQNMYQVTGGTTREEVLSKTTVIPESDVKLVAEQTKKTVEEAQKALEESGGDLAKAILMLKGEPPK
jgi:nascent polypeptide-associated complex subunit alpha